MQRTENSLEFEIAAAGSYPELYKSSPRYILFR
jgi:hypothetical protein